MHHRQKYLVNVDLSLTSYSYISYNSLFEYFVLITQAVNTAPYKLEELINDIEHEQSPTVKLVLLTSIIKLFFKRPPECHKAMKKYIQYCVGNFLCKFYFPILKNQLDIKLLQMHPTILYHFSATSQSSIPYSYHTKYLDCQS